jgi:hypothetical protein
MKTIRDPRRKRLFDPFECMMTDKHVDEPADGRPGLFRTVILHVMPAQELGKHFSPDQGRPSKELHAMAGLILLKEWFNWTNKAACEAYRFDWRVHYALNLDTGIQDLSESCLENYLALFVKDDLAAQVFKNVTDVLVEVCGTRVDKQRLDSTHVFSDMATFGRTRLMGITVKRFLHQLLRYHPDIHEQILESSVHNAEKQATRTIMPTAACSGCPYLRECPVRRVKKVYRLDFTEKERRLAARRAEESTDVFWERYARRAGIEGLFSAMKRTSGFGKLRVRGSPRVGMALYLKAAGWNICRASVSQAGRKHVKKVREAAS